MVVHAKNVFAAGQLGVGLGRVRHSEDLQLLDFKPVVCRKHSSAVKFFSPKDPGALLEDLSCCRVDLEGMTCFPCTSEACSQQC